MTIRPQSHDKQADWSYASLVITMPFIQPNTLPDHVITPTVNLQINILQYDVHVLMLAVLCTNKLRGTT